MTRFDDTPELFGCGAGVSTLAEIKCDICGIVHNKGNEDKDGNINEDNMPSVCHTSFAGLMVCDCCFELIEKEILNRMPDILLWLSRILRARKIYIENAEKLIAIIAENIKTPVQ